jgi:CBS domain-containing protein
VFAGRSGLLQEGVMKKAAMLTARDIMTRKLVTVRPSTPVRDAIRLIVKKRVSGLLVVDDNGNLVGVLSEVDCLRHFAVSQYDQQRDPERGTVATYMTEDCHVISSSTDIYTIADDFLEHRIRRLPVVDGDQLVGVVSRIDVLSGIERMAKDASGYHRRAERTPNLYLSASDSDAQAIARRLE